MQIPFILGSKIIIFFFLLNWALKIEARLTPVVHTVQGPVQGEVLKTILNSKEYSAFRGIPYGEAPLGYSRFKPPVPKKPWTEVLQATLDGPKCVQIDQLYGNYTGSEDCLYLNVYTPKLQLENVTTDLFPVMVWIYGGAFKNGYANSYYYGPDFLIEENVVLVTFNYRLGPFGFLSLDHENATGNAGLKDQNLVLRWVKENIAKFGGDPNSVTIFGQSAGAVSVDFHVLSDMSKGLFQRAIAESGSPLCFWGYQTPIQSVIHAFLLGLKLGKLTLSKDELLKTLYNTSALELLKAGDSIGLLQIPFKPTTESTKIAKNQPKFITGCSFWNYITGNFNKVPYMTGFVSYESLLFSEFFEQYLEKLIRLSNDIRKFFKTIPIPIIDRIIPAVVDLIVYIVNFYYIETIELTTDLIFVAGIDQKRKFIQSHNSYPVYEYRYAFETTEPIHRYLLADINRTEATHADEVSNLFYTVAKNFPLDLNISTTNARKRMLSLWTNFAKYGNPTPQGENDELLQGIVWPDSRINNNYLEFDNNLTIKKNPASLVTEFQEIVNYVILPFQTGCVGALIEKIPDLNPLHLIEGNRT